MVRGERGEHVRERDLAVAVAVARARGVVHHQHRRHASHTFEHHRQTRTQAFGVLPGHRHRVAHVRVWQRGHQEMHRALHTGHVCQSDAEIDLHHARIPLKTQIPVRAFRVRLAPFLHVAAHHAVRAVEPMLGHQPVEDPPGRVPLLARHHPVRLEHLVDQRRVRVRFAPEPSVALGLGRAILLPSVLGDRATIHAQLARDARVRHALPVVSSNILLYRHRNRHVPFLPSQAGGNRPKMVLQLGNIQVRRSNAFLIQATGPHTANTAESQQPQLRKNTAQTA